MTVNDFHLWCLNCVDHQERTKFITNEFDKLGILNNVEFYYNTKISWFTGLSNHIPTIHTPYYDGIKINKTDVYGNVLSCLINWYNIMKISLIRNYEYIMCFEDDVKFCIDRNKLDYILQNLPENFDVIKFWHSEIGYRKNGKRYLRYINSNNIQQYNYQNDLWTNKPSIPGNCWFAYSRKAIMRWLNNCNKYLRVADQNIYYDDNDLNWYYNSYKLCEVDTMKSTIE